MRYFFVIITLIQTVCISVSGQTGLVSNETSQPEKYRAVHWGLDEGLSQGETYHMIKDINGFLWIGTRYGLNRFDGNSFKVYTHDRNNDKSLIANDLIGGLVEDSLHNIWIGSDVGLSRYNIRTEDFTNIFSGATLKNNRTEISPFWATKNEVLCIDEKESVITAYNIYSSAKRVLATLGEYRQHIIGISSAYSVFDSSTKSVWCLVKNPEGKSGLLQIVLPTGQKSFFAFEYQIKKNSQSFAEALCYDAARKCVWVNSTEGLLQFTLNDEKFHHVNALYKYEQVKGYTRFLGIALDKQDRVWFATDPKGIIIYNPANESVNFPFPAGSTTQHNVSDANACIYFDSNNIIWSGFWLRKGIYSMVPYFPVVKYYVGSPKKDSLHSPFVVSAVNAGKGKIWLGTGNGINALNTKANTFSTFQQKDFPGIQTGNGFIAPVAIDTLAQKAWLKTDIGFFKADILTRKCSPIVYKNPNNEIKPVMGVAKFDGKEIFIFNNSDVNTQDVFVLDINSDTAHNILSFTSHLFDIIKTVPVENHFLFFSGNFDEEGNQSYENKNGKWVRIHTQLDSIMWASLAYIKENDTYWVAGENKLFHLDNSFHVIQIYSVENGLPELPITGLIDDNKGNIWFHTDRSIHELNIATAQVKTLSEIDGFEKQNFASLPFVSKDANGNIYYCGGTLGDGFDKISPYSFISPVSSVYIKSLNINQKPFTLKASINYTDTLSLKYNQTKIEIETGIIDFYSNGKSRIRYKLEGKSVNESWHYAPYYYTIRYNSLEPGNYKLVMQASNTSNEFNGPKKVLYINITPAFWDTWWFRMVALTCAVVFIYGLIRWRLHQKFQHQLLQSEKEKQIAELRHKTSELEMQALRSQMNPHFIFNSLNSINRFILQNERAQASEYLIKFSKLVRLILQNSQSSLIPLESELESLELYLSLEALRFNYHFGYKISVPEDLDVSALQVPPLILQPYAENAIWHGLMHKEEKGQLNVEVSEEDNHLYFKITDNGIGREKAAALESKSATKHKSMGLKITASRIAITQNAETIKSPVVINDLINADGSAAGTEVIIKLPIQYD